MASAGETEQVPHVGEEDGTDPKENRKSRKFKPFEAMRKLFKGGRKRTKSKDDGQINVPSGKSKSTNALTAAGSLDDEEEDSDGGFKSHQTKTKLQDGKRSISEDSVFNPGDRGDPSITALKTVAVSEENIHKNAFQNELFSKLKKRHSQYSDEDDGLPQSPVQPVTTADIIAGPLKPKSGKSSSRESEKSLVSLDSSENEMDDLLTKWGSPSKSRSRSSDQSPPPDKTTSMDFEVVKSTMALSNEAAKHKRSVKPVRKTHRQSRKKRENASGLALPSLNEESPTKVQSDDVLPNAADDVDTEVLVITKPVTKEKPLMTMSTTSTKSTVTSSSVTQAKSEVKTVTGSTSKISSVKTVTEANKTSTVKPISESSKVLSSSSRAPFVEVKKVVVPAKEEDTPVRKDSVSFKKEPVAQSASKPDDLEIRSRSSSLQMRQKEEEKPSEISEVLNKMKRRSMKDDLAKEAEKLDLDKAAAVLKETSEDKKESKPVAMTTVTVSSSEKSKESVPKVSEDSRQSKVEEPKSVLRKVEDVKPAHKPEESKSVTLVENSSDKHVSKTVVTGSSDVKQPLSKQSSVESNKDETDAKSDTSSVKSESGYKLGAAAKEEFKLKRQARSKTLPGSVSEQPQLPEEFSVKVQRTKSQRAESSPTAASGAAGQKAAPNSGTPAGRKVDPKRFSMQEPTPVSTEPEWMAAIKKRKAAESAAEKTQEPKKDMMSTSAKDIVIKESEKPVDRMSKSYTAGTTTSSSAQEPPKPEAKKETFTISSSRSTSVKAPAKTETKTESAPLRYGSSVKSPGKSLNIVTTGATPAKPAETTQSSTVTTKPFGGTSSTTSKPFSSSSSRPDSIHTSTNKEPNKEPKVSPTEETKKVFTRGQSVKTVPSTTESSAPSRSGSVKSTSSSVSSSAKPATSLVGKGSVQSSDSSSDKKESVPAWRSQIKPNNKNIEIIEKEPKQDVQMRKKSVSTAPTVPAPAPADIDSCRDSSANRSSKVLDMVKNFQKLQVS